ncbi:serine/threonine-protein kinase [Nocardioides speluncae]|uniref:serine/threonine-protein kinase n=1 Tax=Nocardioides speluncae TaxID=2670337 RepID=UPI000D690B86|nr:serine/threonine-protein kinase [Nocardioides speluncae]
MPRMPAPGDQFGRYTLGRELGEGGMGRVFVATDTQLGREVALKVIQPGLAREAAHRARFEREASILARMDSPHVVQVHDYGQTAGTFYLVTQLVGGGDLFARVRRDGALPPVTAIRLLSQVADGLEHAHKAGVTHRDIKPSNVLLRDGERGPEAVLCDFGIASGPGLELTRTGMISGSLLYMAPERHRGEPGSVAGDIYSAGCLLWFTLTGSAPYAGTEFEIALGHQDSPIPQLPGKGEFVKRVNQILRRSMAKAPRDRYRSMRAMHADLVAAEPLSPATIAVPDRTQLRRPTLARRRYSWAPAAAAASVAVIALVIALIAVLGGRGPDTLDPAAQDEPTEAPTSGTPTAATSTSTDDPSTALTSLAKARNRGSTKAPPGGVPGGVPGQLPSSSGADPTRQPSSSPSSSSSPSQEPSSSPSQSGDPLYRCWDGETSSTYKGCSRPTGYDGLRWMFPSIRYLSGCRGRDPDSYSRYVRTVLQCDDGNQHFRFIQYKSMTDAYNFQTAYFDGGSANREWAFGKSWRYVTPGQRNPDARVRQHSNVYSQKPWGALVWTTKGWTLVDRMLNRIRYREPSMYKGYQVR